MKTNFVEKSKPIMLIGIACKTSNAKDAGPFDIPNHWDLFYQEDILNKIPNKISNDVFALYCDYEKDHTAPYTFFIGCEVSTLENIPQGLVHKVIPRGNYACYQSKGEFPKCLIETWHEIWSDKALKRTFTGDFEVYGEKFGFDPKQVDVFVAVSK